MKNGHAEIAGAGFAGLIAAIPLLEAGWTVRLHERNASARSFGAGIFVWENGLRILKRIGALPDVERKAQWIDTYIIRDSSGRELDTLTLNEATGTRLLVTQRATLHAALAQCALRLGATIAYDSKIVAGTAEGVLIREDGQRFQADLVIGADGSNSSVRSSLFHDVNTVKHRKGAVRLVVPRHADDASLLESRTSIDYVDAATGRRIVIAMCDSEAVYLCMSSMAVDEEARSLPINKESWKNTFPQMSDFIDRISNQGHYDLFYSVLLPKWYLGRAALIGDAAHAMSPALGQGAGCSMMNALALGSAVAAAADVNSALTTWVASIRGIIEHTQQYCIGLTEGRINPGGESLWNDLSLKTARYQPSGAA